MIIKLSIMQIIKQILNIKYFSLIDFLKCVNMIIGYKQRKAMIK